MVDWTIICYLLRCINSNLLCISLGEKGGSNIGQSMLSSYTSNPLSASIASMKQGHFNLKIGFPCSMISGLDITPNAWWNANHIFFQNIQTGCYPKYSQCTLSPLCLLSCKMILTEVHFCCFVTVAGGTFALYSLICRHAKVSLLPNQLPSDARISSFRLKVPSAELERSLKVKERLETSLRLKKLLLMLVLAGTSMVIADGVVTPTMSGFFTVPLQASGWVSVGINDKLMPRQIWTCLKPQAVEYFHRKDGY